MIGIGIRIPQNGKAPFSPLALAPDYYWQAGVGVSTPGGAVSSWDDQAAAVSATQGTAANRPTHSASNSDWNSQPSLTGDGGDRLAIDTADLALSGQKFFHDDTTDWEVALLARPSSLPGTRGIIGTNDSSGNNQGFVAWLLSTGAVSVSIFNGTAGNSVATPAGAVSVGTKCAIGIRYTRSARQVTIFTNGSSLATGAIVIAPSAANPVHSLNLMASGNGVIPFFGSCPEVVVFKRALSTADRSALTGHWRSKYAF